MTSTTGKTTKRAKVGIARYIDDMAEEDDEDENDEKIVAARLRLEEEHREMKSEMERQDRRRKHETLFKGEDADVAGVVKSLHDRYQRTTQLAHDLDNLDNGIPFANSRVSLVASRHAATRQAHAPSLTDPRLWVVPCKSGCENEAALALMNKCIAMMHEGNPLSICGAMATGLSGFIYVESRSEPAARAAVKGLRLLRGWLMKMVPMNDMVAVISKDLDAPCGDEMKRRNIQIGSWARVSRDKYRGDLCRIVTLGDGGSSAVIMLVPRLKASSENTTDVLNGHSASRSKVRPPSRLFNAAEVVAAGGHVSQQKFRFNGNATSTCRNTLADETFDVFENGFYLHGFLYKEVNILTMLQPGDPNPTLDELQRFVVDTEWLDNGQRLKAEHSAAHEHQGSLMAQIERLACGVRKTENGIENNLVISFAKDDRVEAIDGEMRGTVFVVVRVDSAGIVHCKVADELQNDEVGIPMEPHRLVKSIPVGSHVKVQDGKYAGQTGVVLERGELDGDHVGVILTDCGGREITVRLLHVQESREVSRGLDALEGYELYDLVLLPLGAVGVITHVASEDVEVLTLRGDLKIVRPAEIARKLNHESARNISLDSKDEHVRETDHVVLDSGQDAGTLATVIRAHRASLWLLKTVSGAAFAPCGGLFVRKARQVHVAGDRASSDSLADTYMGLGKQRVVNEDQFNDKGTGTFRSRGGTADPFIGRTVRICKGNYKGLAGIVTTTSSTHVTVELHTRNRSVTLPRGCVKIVAGTAGGEPELAIRRRIAEQEAYNADLLSTPFLTQATPLLSGATPQYGAATPHHSTPSHTATTPIWGNTTPAFGPQNGLHTLGHGNATPGHTGLEDVWRPRTVGKSPPSAMSPGYLGMGSVHINNKSPAFGESFASTPNRQPPPLLQSESRSYVWCVEGAEAKLENGQVCKITNVVKNMVTVALKGSLAVTRSLPMSALLRVQPETGNKVRVVDGGKVYDAELLSIEDSDGIIKLTSGEYKIIDFSAIATIAKF
eukprot:CAMPEP_0119274702 /NCGR_PEP_ID=MMETSP1329-20130426/12632_1 /TAXON_ID=114041 /ORGANISM="Genus nov. species nov., Strain RCC1024" /LENGTH=1009 /DNA_ID=CAMNT_0007275045 /DNA_START=223 /DNA_END=3252 /DNA_ORIENTATION=+